MSSGYRFIFIGLLLVLIDIRIEVFDILPDFIGYIFIVNGINALVVKGSPFEKARIVAFALIFLSLPTLVGLWETGHDVKHFELLPATYQLALGIAHLVLMYYIFKGTWELAQQCKDDIWVNIAKARWNFYALIQFVFLFFYTFLFNFPTIKPLVVILIVLVLIAEIVAIVFVKKTQRQSEQWDS